MVGIGFAQDARPGGGTAGQLAGKPIAAGVRSSASPQAWSGPPHGLQIATFSLARALRMAAAVGSPGTTSGHGCEWMPRILASQHFWSSFDLVARNFCA